MPDFVECPEPGCIAPAELLDRYTLISTDGPVEHWKVQCLMGHHFNGLTNFGTGQE